MRVVSAVEKTAGCPLVSRTACAPSDNHLKFCAPPNRMAWLVSRGFSVHRAVI